MPYARNLLSALAHVLWIGGAPDAGKTSIAKCSRKQQLQVYHFDRHEPAHFDRADPQHPRPPTRPIPRG